MKQASLERTYDAEKTSRLEHGTAIPKETDDKRKSTGYDKNVGYHSDDIGVRFVLQNKKGTMRMQIELTMNISSLIAGCKIAVYVTWKSLIEVVYIYHNIKVPIVTFNTQLQLIINKHVSCLDKRYKNTEILFKRGLKKYKL